MMDTQPHSLAHSSFLDNIRAVAALLVVFFHYAIFFFIEQPFCAELSCAPPLEGVSQWPFVETLSNSSFDLGQFAVGFFFLLSGFLLPLLVVRYPTRSTFFRNRFFRLWPVYAVGLVVNLIFIKGASLYYTTHFPHTDWHIMTSLFCLRPFFDYPYITGVVWTFEIEVFLILFCILFYSFLKPLSSALLFIQVALFAVAYMALYFIDMSAFHFLPQVLWSFAKTIKFIALIFMGTYLNLFVNKKITPLRFWVCESFLVTLFFGESLLSLSETSFMRYLVSYSLSLSVFFCLTFLDQKKRFVISRKFNFLSFISEISYPLYLLHAVPGYVIAYILHSEGVPLFLGLTIGFVIMFLLSVVVHFLIEKPCRETWSRAKT